MTHGVFAIIKDGNGKILVSERNDGKGWNLPGGGVKEGETERDALIREVLEETGLEVIVLKPAGVPLVFKEDVAVAYHCSMQGGELVTTNEAKAHRWVSSAETKELAFVGLRMLCMTLTGFYT